jgi:hypothetical protein
VVLKLAAIGITNGTWRNSPLEGWHAVGRIHDGGMLRTNVATTKLVRDVLTDQVGAIIGGDVPLIATEDLDDLEADFCDELFMRLFERLSDATRVLPDGRSLRQLAGQDLDDLVDHMDRTLGGIAADADQHGLDFAMQRTAAHGGLACAHWWGTPWWPDIVTEFLARLKDPHHPHWGNDGDRYARLPTQPDEGAEFCVGAGIGFISEPIRVWKAARTKERGLHGGLWTMSRTCGCSLDRFRMPVHPDLWLFE